MTEKTGKNSPKDEVKMLIVTTSLIVISYFLYVTYACLEVFTMARHE